MNELSLSGLWDGLFPDNLDSALCTRYVHPAKAVEIPRAAGTLAMLWEASKLKADMAGHSEHYARFTDESWISLADEYFGDLPKRVEEELRNRVRGRRKTLSLAIPDDERWSWERFEAPYPELPAETVNLILRFLEERSAEIVHYVGCVDAALCKGLVGAGKFKLTIMDMLNKHESGHGYRFDTDLNLTYFGWPPWLKGVAFYPEGAPQLPDAWIRDSRWDWPEHLEELMNGRRQRQRMSYLILLGDAIEHGRHPYFRWTETGGVHFGELREEYRPDLPEEERADLMDRDRRMRGEGNARQT